MWRHGWKLLILILIGSVVFFWLIKASLMSAYLTKKIGTQVTIRTMSTWPSQTVFRHFRIANPPGFKSGEALEVNRSEIDYRWKALTAEKVEIDLITLDQVDLNIEIKNPTGSNNNWSALGALMPDRKKGKEVIVHKLILKNMTVRTLGAGAKILGVAGVQHFDYMEFDEINSLKGFPTKELISRIFQGAGLRKYLENFLNPTEQIQNVLNPFHIFGEKEAPGINPEG